MEEGKMSKDEVQAVKELIEKIPAEDLEKAVGGMSEDTKETLRKFFNYVKISVAAVGAGALLCKYWPKGDAGDPARANASSENPSEQPASARRVYRYRTDNGIKKAYKDHRLKNLTQLRDAYISLHPDFNGSKQEVLTLLGL